MRSPAVVAVLLLVAVGCAPTPRPRSSEAAEDVGPSKPFRPERMRAAVAGKELPAVRRTLAGRWAFRVTVVGQVEELSVGYFTAEGDASSVERTGVIAVRLPADAAPGQTWEVEAAFDFDLPTLREHGLLVWRFARPTAAVRAG